VCIYIFTSFEVYALKYSSETSKQQPEQAGLLYLRIGNDISALQCSNKLHPPCACCSYRNHLTAMHLSKEQSTNSSSKISPRYMTCKRWSTKPSSNDNDSNYFKVSECRVDYSNDSRAVNNLWNIILTIYVISLYIVVLRVHSEANHVKFRAVLNYKSRP